jgi:fluoride exporter
MRTCMLIGLGGFLGAVLRYLFSLIPVSEKIGFPIVTLLINIAGAFLLGVLAGLTAKDPALDTEWMAALKIGICGGFTTFSTFALEGHALLGSARIGTGVLYIVLSLVLGIGAVWIGRMITA